MPKINQTSNVDPMSIDSNDLNQAFKQFILESERLEMTYRHLKEKFEFVQSTLQDSHSRLDGKMAELNFVTGYLEAILQHISQGILFIDSNGIVTTYNPAAQQIMQIPESNLLFHGFKEYFADDFFGFSLQNSFMTKQCPGHSFVSWKRTNDLVELEIESNFVTMVPQSPIAYKQTSMPSASIQGLLIIMRDVTRLRQLQQMANRNDRLKNLGELAAHLAHEIRNPLGGIKGFATLLHHELKDRPDLQSMASNIIQGTDDLNQFVTQVLHYARPPQLHLENIDLIQLVEEVKQLLQADPKWKPNIDFELKSERPSYFLLLDGQLMRSALLNLFVNAIQAMPDGGKITVSFETDSAMAILRIKDTGIGIAPENLSKLFSPFFTTKETGNGLGLSEVNQAIHAHQGWIDVESQEGKGTAFSLRIPLKRGE